MKIAFFVNYYPMMSLSFIRREIAALEEIGISVARFSIRSCVSELVDEADRLESEKTRVIFGVGAIGLLSSLLRVALTRPIRFWQALWLTFKIGWSSDRGIFINLGYLAEACVLLKWFADAEISQVHAHFGTNPAAVAMLCHVLGGPPYSFTVHGPKEFDSAPSIALSEKIKRSVFVVAISSFGKSQLYRSCDYQDWSKIHVVHCGVDEMFLNAPHQTIPDNPQLVCVGRL